MPTRLLTGTATLAVAVLVAVGMAGSAQAAAYRYWTYWQGGAGTWAFATAGPASTIPADGSVEGWRFAVTTSIGSASDAPATNASFEDICAGTPVQADRKRVALVIDPGPQDIAPEGQQPPGATTACIVAEPDATGYQVLRSAATVRTDGGLICAIDDYPAGECAPVVDLPGAATSAATPASLPPASASPEPVSAATAMDPGAPETGGAGGAPWLTAAVMVLVAVAAMVVWRRRHE
jgi:MYXO-CTERM domain-containing protein